MATNPLIRLNRRERAADLALWLACAVALAAACWIITETFKGVVS